jgi:hypothetical protein
MNKIPLKKAASILGISEELLRWAIRQGSLPIGTAIKRKKRFTYYINKDKLEQYIGKEVTGCSGGCS